MKLAIIPARGGSKRIPRKNISTESANDFAPTVPVLLETYYHDCGQFYHIRTQALQREQELMVANTVPMVMDELEVQDIDNESDWKLAEIKYRIMTGAAQ